MFEPAERQDLLDLLRPPNGYRLESAVATTYGMDFVALTAVLLAFVDADGDTDESVTKPIESLHAITRLADRVRIFVNRGQITGPRQVSRVTALYDHIVHEVRLPEGAFHPKVWLARYCPRMTPGSVDRPSLLRMICTSRNLTTSQCWEAFIAIEGHELKGKQASPISTGVREFLSRLMSTELKPSPVLVRLREAFGRASFDLPRPLRGHAEFLWQWHDGGGLGRYLPVRGRRALVVSPFVGKSFLADIARRFDEIVLVSSQRQLDAITDNEFMTRLCQRPNRVYVVTPADTDDGEDDDGIAMELHAKLLICEDPKSSATFLGSANASHNAWGGRNCEALVKFSPGVSIDHFCDRFIFSQEAAQPRGRRPLRGWMSEYQRQPLAEDESDHAKKQLDDICAAIAQFDIHATYEPESMRLTLSLQAIPQGFEAAFSVWIQSWHVGLALLSQFHSDASLKPLTSLLEGHGTFGEIGLADLTEFVLIQVTHRQLEIQRRFILKAHGDLSQWREQRDTQLLQQLLTRDRLQDFLKAILFDKALRPPETSSGTTGETGGGVASVSLFSELSIEDVIRSCTEDRSRIDEINRVFKAFESTQLIDDKFRQFWGTFVSAEAEVQEGREHG